LYQQNEKQTMALIPMFIKELEQEAQTTRKMLSIVPDDKFDWQPHPKSMTLRRLATHVAELPGWVPMTIHTSELDFANNQYKPEVFDNIKDVQAYFEKNQAQAIEDLKKTNEAELDKPWTLRNGDYIISTRPKAEVIRMAINQTVHHRAQLGVFLRLLDIPIPGSYGPSADEMM
jgi:uncharacterized damage-inducible protein DinB